MPDIPNWKGIPDAAINAGISLGGGALINTLFGNYWGIFNEFGVPLLLADNVLSLQYQNQSRVVNAPIEKGSFTSYNKVADPYKATVQLSKSSGGTLERGAFLAQLEILAKSTLKFYIITPEYVYKSANIVGFDFAREARDGATLIKVNVHLEEIREVSIQYDEEEVTNPDDARLKDTGNKTQQVSSVFTGETLDEIMKIIDDPTKSALLKTSEVAQVIYKGLSGLGADLEQVKGQAEMIVRQGVGYQ
ncbi:phage baseplate protein [Moellerella wisconsensis]|uniref:phage baseplate protein n=1 Tax=Moellerella wisconsensis TaxID=158849 RepID=UPI0030766478